jgi:hypothetical protein
VRGSGIRRQCSMTVPRGMAAGPCRMG